MKVILCEDIEKLGATGETVKVKDGYARNYLIPKNLALEATTGNTRVVDEIKKKRQLAAEREKEKAQTLCTSIQSASCTISSQAGEDEKLFGAVTSADIAEAFESEGFKLDKKQILLDEPIKKLGVFQVSIKLHPEVTASVKVWVVKQ